MNKYLKSAFIQAFLLFGIDNLLAEPKTVPTVVKVKTYETDKAEQALQESMGFVFEQDGFILTSYKNLTDPETGRLITHIDVYIPSLDKTYPATIVGVEPTINLGILKIFADSELNPSQLVMKEGIQVGEAVYVPHDFDGGKPELTLGRITGLNNKECYQESLTSTMLSAELELDEHSIGAPVFNEKGNVVANYTGYQPQSADGHQEDDDEIYILPTFLANNIYDSLKSKNNLKSPWTGFSVTPLNEEQKHYFPTEHGDKGGIGIEYIWENSPAEKLGIEVDDILVRLGHYRIESPADFQKWLYMYGVGHHIKLVFLRNGKDYIIKEYTIEERPDWARPK